MKPESGAQLCNLCHSGQPVAEFRNLLGYVCHVCGPCLLAAIKALGDVNPDPLNEAEADEDTPLTKIEQSITEVSGQWLDGFSRGVRDNVFDRPSRILKLYGLSDVEKDDGVRMDRVKAMLRYIPLEQQAWLEGYKTGYYEKNIEDSVLGGGIFRELC